MLSAALVPDDDASPAPRSEEPRQPSTRYADRPTRLGTRLFGIAGVSTIALLLLAGMLFTWQSYTAPPAPPALSVFDVASPPEPANDLPPSPEHPQPEQPLPEPDAPPVELPEIRLASESTPPVPTVKPAPDPAPRIEKTTAPQTSPVPPAPQVSNAAPTWQGQVLASLNKVKRYPREAHFRRQQGVPFIRFVMNREGRVLSVTLERSSGHAQLDREALDLPRRAQPFPSPPDEVPGTTVELVVPVEFFLSARR